jgi:two-component system, NtrC family, sensor kinase
MSQHSAAAMTEMAGQVESLARLVDARTQSTLNQFAAGLLHELNSPLGTLRSSLDTLGKVLDRTATASDPVPGDELGARRAQRALAMQQELFELMKTSCARMSEVLGSMSRSVGLDEANLKLVDLRQKVQDAVSLLGPELEDRIAVVCSLPDRPALVLCSSAKLSTVIANLQQNAINAIAGAGEIRIAMTEHADRVELTVQDDGCGMTADRLSRIFDIGFSTKKQGRMGLQLGLSSGKRVIEELGGTLTITSQEHEGTTVRIVLPLQNR